MNRRNRILWIPTCLLFSLAGCQKISSVPVSDMEQAHVLLTQALQSWKDGKSVEDLRALDTSDLLRRRDVERVATVWQDSRSNVLVKCMPRTFVIESRCRLPAKMDNSERRTFDTSSPRHPR